MPQRLLSLDAYRGLVMLAIASHGLGIAAAARHYPDRPAWQRLGRQFEHVDWVGCTAWDLIQPSFMFMVGVAMAYSYAKRRDRADSYGTMFQHAVIRSAVLVAMGVFLASNWSDRTNFVFTNVLAQIGLGYVLLFLLWGRRPSSQFLAAGAILVGYWALFALYPRPGVDFDFARVGLPTDWPHLSGFAAHWGKNTNAAAAIDRWFLNVFPRDEPFVFSGGGYQTLNFVPSLATMIFGLMAGELLRSERPSGNKLGLLVGAGVMGLAFGTVLNQAGLCPMVKRIWTPSWTMFSTGWTCLLLACFYGSIDAFRAGRHATLCQWLAFPLIVVGTNSLTMYFMAQLIHGWVRKTLRTHLGTDYAQVFGPPSAPIVEATAAVIVLWLICFWLYRQRVFLRV